MRHPRVVVMGAGVAGMATALLLSRDGNPVTIVERDDFAVSTVDDAIGWKRKGVPHFIQPHSPAVGLNYENAFLTFMTTS